MRVNEQIIFMNDTMEVEKMLLRLCELLQINLLVECNVDVFYF